LNTEQCAHPVLHFPGKIGGFIASIPQVMAAGLLVFMWTMLAALGLSNLRYSETGSSRNVLIVGFSLFLSLSVPAYFQQYKLSGNGVAGAVPSYFQQYTTAANGPINTKYQTVLVFSVLSLWC
jgi:nucleobase transporter 1/2